MGALALLAGLTLSFTCSSPAGRSAPPPEDSGPPRVVITTAAGAEVTVQVELARTPAQRERGLMFRQELGADSGMLFLFPDEGFRQFWMKNTLLPLDLIFISADHTIVAIIPRALPESENRLDPGRPAQFVLEVNGGFCAAHSIAAGDRLRFFGLGD